jgi:dTDP-4-amino-4,6-dideoxygalactose transaminase
MNVHQNTIEFEKKICEYTGAPFCVCLENESEALFLALTYFDVRGKSIGIPSRTYPSVPCEIIHAGGKVEFYEVEGTTLKGMYLLRNTTVIDSALHFTTDMYIRGTFMCCSFTGPYKHLNLGKGGCILTDNEKAYRWFKKARYSGRNEVSYHEDDFTSLGWNFYMNPMTSALGLLNIQKFWNQDGEKKNLPDIELSYPDLSKFPIYTL